MAKSEIDLVPVTNKKSKLSLVLLALLIVMTGTAGFFGWRYFSASPKAANAPKAALTEGEAEESAEASEAPAEEGEHAATAGHGEKTVQSTVLNFEPFLVNLADRDTSRYLRITIKLQVANKASAEKIASAEVLTSQIRDTILGTLSTKVADQIVTREGKDQLKTEIADKLNAFLPGKPIKAVFFTDFVVQL